MSTHQIFLSAAESVDSGWAQRAWVDEDGNICMLQAIGTSLKHGWNQEWDHIPDHLNAQIDAELSKYLDYRLLKATAAPIIVAGFLASKIGFKPRRDLEIYIITWNDLPWRRKNQVVRSLLEIGRRLEFDWLKDERLRLSVEVSSLRDQVGELRARVAHLEAENDSLWARLKNRRALENDRETLRDLESELAQSWEELQKVEAHA